VKASVCFWLQEENVEKLLALYNCEKKPCFERLSGSKSGSRSKKTS
jgi:hypothetical protein